MGLPILPTDTDASSNLSDDNNLNTSTSTRGDLIVVFDLLDVNEMGYDEDEDEDGLAFIQNQEDLDRYIKNQNKDANRRRDDIIRNFLNMLVKYRNKTATDNMENKDSDDRNEL
jgi:hypothetical protein